MRSLVEGASDLALAQKATGNAFSLYLKTRPPAAPESVARAKGLPKVGRAGGGGLQELPGLPGLPGF